MRPAPSRRTCAVIIAAWQAQRWIRECIESVRAQRNMRTWNVDVRVAVDACPATSEALRKLGVSHWWSPENVGPYLLRNTLIERAEADAYCIFDADDVMEPRYLDYCLRLARPHGIGGAARTTIDERGRIRSKRSPYAHGVSVIMHDAWKRVGGYRSYRVAADADLIARAEQLGIRVRSTSRPLYRRRKHPHGLTVMPGTGIGSELREAVKDDFARRIEAGDLVVVPETIPLEWRRA